MRHYCEGFYAAAYFYLIISGPQDNTFLSKNKNSKNKIPNITRSSQVLDTKRFYNELEELANIDSGSYCTAGVTRIAEWFADGFAELGWKSVWYDLAPGKQGKSVFVGPEDLDEMDLFVICHVDTVFPEGEAAKRPFSTGENRIFGPGVADMKSGCLFTLYALEQLVAEGADLGRIGVFFNGEHEISCPNTRKIIEEYSAKSRMVITAEPTRANGAHVKQRKGILRYTVTFEGKTAHSGNNPEDGVCAVTEMAHWILFFKSLENHDKGISATPGMAHGGETINAVPDKAELRVDMRVARLEDALDLEKTVGERKPFDPRVTVTVKGGTTRPPMMPNEQTEELCAIVEEIGKELDLPISWAFAGGGSDGSFASAVGKPVLCGLGPVSGKMHTKDEFINTTDLEKRFLEFKEIVRRFSNHSFKAA